MESHDQDHELLLERIVLGDLPRTDNVVRALLQSCTTCRERLSEFDALELELAAAGANERADIAQAAGASLEPGAQRRIQEFVDAQVGRPSVALRRMRIATWALAASLCAVLAYRLTSPAAPVHPGPGAGDLLLGDQPTDPRELPGAFPRGSKVDGFARFGWDPLELSPGQTLRLRITNPDMPTETVSLDTIGSAGWNQQNATSAESRRMERFLDSQPRNIEWVLEIYGTNRQLVRGYSPVRASLD